MVFAAFRVGSLAAIQRQLQLARTKFLLPLEEPIDIDPTLLDFADPSLPLAEYLQGLGPLLRCHVIFNLLFRLCTSCQLLVILV